RLRPAVAQRLATATTGPLSDESTRRVPNDAPAEGEFKPLDHWTLPVLPLDQRQQRFDALDAEVRACRRCEEIVHFRRQTVFGEGTLQPTVCFMGEAPGADEDRLGRPFVGRAGQLLDKIIIAMKLRREEVYILNALKCRPPQNRTPDPQEIDNCRPFVETQLEVLQPKFIVCLGAVAARSLLRTTSPIGRLRGRFHPYKGARVVVTYHPSYLLRNENAKRLVWEDMKMLMRELGIQP
ncbi:MAG: uracil-DNA glycosylase, partial [Planctomycetota bacterium]